MNIELWYNIYVLFQYLVFTNHRIKSHLCRHKAKYVLKWVHRLPAKVCSQGAHIGKTQKQASAYIVLPMESVSQVHSNISIKTDSIGTSMQPIFIW